MKACSREKAKMLTAQHFAKTSNIKKRSEYSVT